MRLWWWCFVFVQTFWEKHFASCLWQGQLLGYPFSQTTRVVAAMEEVEVPLSLSDKGRIWASIVILISLSLRLYSQRELVCIGLVRFWLVSLSGWSRAGDDFVVFVWKNQPPISVSLLLFFYVCVHSMCIYLYMYIYFFFFFFFFLSMLWWLFLASNWT